MFLCFELALLSLESVVSHNRLKSLSSLCHKMGVHCMGGENIHSTLLPRTRQQPGGYKVERWVSLEVVTTLLKIALFRLF